MKTTLGVTVDAAWFEGHFPGRPILPAVSQLALVLEALARHRGQPAALEGIGFARMRQPVVPGDPLQLEIDERPGGALRFTLARDGAMVTNGELLPGTVTPTPSLRCATASPSRGPGILVGPCGAEMTPTPSLRCATASPSRGPGILGGPCGAGEAPSDVVAFDTDTNPIDDATLIESLLPHRPPMRFVTSVLAESPDGMTCSARIPAGCALVAQGSAPAVAAIEAAAQTAAVWEATRRRRAGGMTASRLGYLVGLRDITFFAQRIPAEQTLRATVRLEAATLALTHYAMQVDLGSAVILRGTLATFLTDETLRER